ncbi:MAG: Molybdopterin adenylyltransferase, partial [uncultured Thermoleophilia bacterium]
ARRGPHRLGRRLLGRARGRVRRRPGRGRRGGLVRRRLPRGRARRARADRRAGHGLVRRPGRPGARARDRRDRLRAARRHPGGARTALPPARAGARRGDARRVAAREAARDAHAGRVGRAWSHADPLLPGQPERLSRGLRRRPARPRPRTAPAPGGAHCAPL